MNIRRLSPSDLLSRLAISIASLKQSVLVRRVCALSALLVLAACTASSSVPVVERSQPPSEKINDHWVSEGETLYAIAWRYNMDVAALARANGIEKPYRINVGQTLRLDIHNVPSRRIARHTATKQSTRASTQPVAISQPRSEGYQLPGESHQPLSDWRWPTKGQVLKRFSYRGNAGHKGLDIKGRTGQPVYATQNGVVVYAGSGLPAYGKLLIVKHNDTYLSAYAHNSRLSVSEGDRVRTGQKVAEVGQSGTSHQHLHFEIRKKGVPVDPLKLLPRA